MSESLTTVILVGAVVTVGYVLWKSAPPKRNVPPGPRRWPLIGSVLEIPRAHQWVTFSKWAETYGNIVYVDALGQPLFIINSAKVAIDLLDKRSSIYSDRPSFVSSPRLGLQSYNENWRQQRKIIAQDFSPNGVTRYYPLQERESRKLAHGLLNDPSTLTSQTQLRVGIIIFRIVYGYLVTDENDPFLTAALKKMEIFSKSTTPGVWAVDFLPLLRYIPSWLPGSGFLQIAKQWRKISRDAAWGPYLWCKNNLATGTVLLPNLCAQHLTTGADEKMSAEQEYRLVCAADIVLGGGLDTASSTRNTSSILTFFLAMILNPSVQRKAQEEIDAVIGPDRLPVIQDRPSLPYVRALVTEVFRWHPAGPIGNLEAFEGIHFPKGSVLIPNAWQYSRYMLHDPEVYSNPMEFDPDRYRGLDSEMDKVTDIRFGFGRRACPGRYLAEGTLFAVAVTVLATCEILPIRDDEGNAVLPEVSYTSESGIVASPSPFDCDIKCRSQKAFDLLVEGCIDDEAR
ncbi:putative monooxygenase [Mycena sanguinolenta]|nr:putative monooxygenase [Mycena sanguinolenta]